MFTTTFKSPLRSPCHIHPPPSLSFSFYFSSPSSFSHDPASFSFMCTHAEYIVIIRERERERHEHDMLPRDMTSPSILKKEPRRSAGFWWVCVSLTLSVSHSVCTCVCVCARIYMLCVQHAHTGPTVRLVNDVAAKRDGLCYAVRRKVEWDGWKQKIEN